MNDENNNTEIENKNESTDLVPRGGQTWPQKWRPQGPVSGWVFWALERGFIPMLVFATQNAAMQPVLVGVFAGMFVVGVVATLVEHTLNIAG